MSRQLTAPTPSVRRLSIVAPVNKGGTAGDNTVDAAAQLGAINASLIGAAGGPAKVQVGGLVDVNALPSGFPKGATLDGPTDFFVSASHTLTITNYDAASDASYTVAASAGTISRSGATITFVAPATIQTVTLTIGTRQVTVNVKSTAPINPSILTPANMAVNQNSSVTATSSAFQLPTGSPSHQFSDWELATDSSFNNVIQSTFNDSVNKTSWTMLGLTVATVYFLRCRYKDTNLGYSAWSTAVQFTTKASFTVAAEEAKLVHSDKNASDFLGANGQYGGPLAISADGTRIAIGAPSKTWDPASSSYSFAGAVYVFVRNTATNTWTQEVKFARDNTGAGGATTVAVSFIDISDYFGCSLSFSADGTRLAIGSYGDETTSPLTDVTQCGTAYIALRTGTSWAIEQRIYAADRAVSDQLGWSVSLTPDATRLAVSAWQADISGVNNCGVVYIWLRTGSTWAQEAKIMAADRAADNGFGSCVAINGDGSRVVVGAYNNDESGNANSGAAYIFVRSGVTWGQEQKLVAGTIVTAGLMGMSVAIDTNGVRCVIGQPAIGASVPGRAQVWVRDTNSNVWTLEANLAGSDTANNDNFGISVSVNASGTVLVVGASIVTSTVSAGGGLYTFTRSGSSWTQASKLVASDRAATDRLGISVAMASDGSRVVGAAYQADPGGTSNAGAAYVYA